MSEDPFDTLLEYLTLRSSEITEKITNIMKEQNSPEVILELERLKAKSFEFDRIIRFRTSTDFMDETEYYENLERLFGI